jgi:hypothetical protein
MSEPVRQLLSSSSDWAGLVTSVVKLWLGRTGDFCRQALTGQDWWLIAKLRLGRTGDFYRQALTGQVWWLLSPSSDWAGLVTSVAKLWLGRTGDFYRQALTGQDWWLLSPSSDWAGLVTSIAKRSSDWAGLVTSIAMIWLGRIGDFYRQALTMELLLR